MQQESLKSYVLSFRDSFLLRGGLVLLIVLGLQIPIVVIAGLVYERESTRSQAEYDIAAQWGQKQAIRGPFLVLPYDKHWIDSEGVSRSTIEHLVFSPETLDVKADTKAEIRYRGIYEVPVYTAQIQASGKFAPPSFKEHAVSPSQIRWDQARIVLGISDTKSITNSPVVTLDGATIAFQPGVAPAFLQHAVAAPIAGLSPETREPLSFAFGLDLRGSQNLSFQPAGLFTKITMTSDWPDPSFFGRYLPVDRSISAAGFSSTWEVPYIGRNYPASWTGNSVEFHTIAAADFGVDMVTPVDTYRMTDRALKYEFLFTALTFLTLFMCEIFARIKIHPIQYLLVGGALCMFYLLTLSMAEHIGYGIAYAFASAAIVAMNGTYLLKILGKGRAGIVATVMTSLYAFLYVLLSVQDYALLLGSVALTIILAIIMVVTRNIDWYNLRFAEPAKAE